MSRKGSKDKDEPEDPLNKALLEELKSERLSTALMQNEYEQKVAKEKLKQLDDDKREPKQTFLSGMSYSETLHLAEELQGIKLYLYLILGDFVDRSKKMKPEEFRKELLALVKMIPLTDQADMNKVFLEGMKTMAGLFEKIQAARLRMSPGSSSVGSTVSGGKTAEAAPKASSSGSQNEPQLQLLMRNNVCYTEAGKDATFNFYLWGYTDSVHLGVKGIKSIPGLEAKVTRLTPSKTPDVLEGACTLTIPVSASPGNYEFTLEAFDSARTSTAHCYLTITSHAP